MAYTQFTEGKPAYQIIGKVPSLDSTDTFKPRNIWTDGGKGMRVKLSANDACTIVSASANDTGAGTGARTVKVEGFYLDDDDNVQFREVTVTLNGTTPVSLGNFLSPVRTTVLTAGSSGFNAGALSVRDNAGLLLLDYVALGESRSFTASYVVPAGKRALIKNIKAWTQDDTEGATIYMSLYKENELVSQLRLSTFAQGSPSNPVEYMEYIEAGYEIDFFALTADSTVELWMSADVHLYPV